MVIPSANTCNSECQDSFSQVLESHQAGKLDTSGTAKDVIACFEKLGVSYDMNRVCFYLLCLKTLLNYSCYERKAVCALENTSMLLKLPQCFHGSRSLPSFFLLFSYSDQLFIFNLQILKYFLRS